MLTSKHHVTKEIEIDGTERSINFYPFTLRTVFRARVLSKTVTSAVMDLMQDASQYGDNRKEQEVEGDGKTRIVNFRAALPEEAVLRLNKKKAEAIDQIAGVLLEEKNMDVVARLIEDSTRDDSDITKDSLLSADIKVFMQMVEGVMESNRESFAPLLNVLSLGRGAQQTEETDETLESEN